MRRILSPTSSYLKVPTRSSVSATATPRGLTAVNALLEAGVLVGAVIGAPDGAGGGGPGEVAAGVLGAGPGPPGAVASLAAFRRIDALEPHLDAADDKAVAVDGARGAGDVGAVAGP